MTPIGPIDRLGNQLVPGLYMHQKSRRVALVTRADDNSHSANYFPNSGGKGIQARYLTPFTPEMASTLLQQEDVLRWLSNQTRERPDLRRAVNRSLESRTKST